MPYFLGLNGPPGSGKDTMAEAILNNEDFQDQFTPVHLKFADPLKNAVHTLFGGVYSEEEKDKPSPYGPTWRELYIGMSELYAKKVVDSEVFGSILTERIRRILNQTNISSKPYLFVVSDCGFMDEQKPVLRYMNNHALWVTLHRKGKNFTGDSRSYIDIPGKTIKFFNNEPLEEAKLVFVSQIERVFIEKGWME